MPAGSPLHDSPHGARPGGPPAQRASATEPTRAPTAPIETFKQGQRTMWALGDYPAVSRDLLTPLAERLVAECGIREGQHVLDVAAGAGNVALRAAGAGAHVVAADLTPSLFPAGQAEAVERRVALEWVEADAEDLPFDDAMFDTVVSCVGVMFAPRHHQVADEMVRVCRPGGTIGLVSWTPQGTVAGFFAVLARYQQPGPDVEPLLWGDPAHVRWLFGDRVDWRTHMRETLWIDRFATPEDLCSYYKANFGPTMRTYADVADDPERTAALDRDFLTFAREHARYDGQGRMRYEYEYLLSVGTVRER